MNFSKSLLIWIVTSSATVSAYECESKAIYGSKKEYLGCETKEFDVTYEHDPREMTLEHCKTFCQVDQENEHDFPFQD
jgi:hypothetical protein